MLSDEEKMLLKGILKHVSCEDLISLALTVTQNMVCPTSVEEAVEAVLLHSQDVESVLSRKKVHKETLFKYLHEQKVPLPSSAEKRKLISHIIMLWKTNILRLDSSKAVTNPTITADVPHCNNAAIAESAVSSEEATEMAKQFSKWFYTMLNQYTVGGEGEKMGVQHFWTDSSMRLVMSSASSSEEHVVEGAQSVVQRLCETAVQHQLYFNPNLTTEGTRGRSDPHGLVVVLSCGTVHQQHRCVGLFEQIFSLARDPFLCNNWKIKCTELHLNSKECLNSQPTIDNGTLSSTFLTLTGVSHTS